MELLVKYLRDNIMGKTLYTDELTYTLEEGALEGVYSDQMSFTNLLSSPTGLRFDLFVVSREKVFVVGADKRRGELRKDYSGASHFHYELARRKSTGGITGFMRYVAASFDSVPAEAMASAVFDFQLKDGSVTWEEKEVIYRDMPGIGDSVKPASFEAKCRFYCEDGKARYEYNGVCLDVNPDDGTRSPSSAVIPAFVSKER